MLCTQYWTLEEAEAAKVAQKTQHLPEHLVGFIEEDIRQFGVCLRSHSQRDILSTNSRARRLLSSISKRWPSLRATTEFNSDVDFILIPRAMQAEEDLQRYIQEFLHLQSVQASEIS